MPTITVCMIVRNEEENIGRCLESVRHISDEIAVVDTGSTDRTKLVCGEYGAHIYDVPWTKSFSDARNFSLEQAAGDWVLCLDADEELEVFDPSELKQFLRETADDVIFVPMVHFYGAAPASDKRAYLSSSPRLFRNGRGLRYTGRIHEHLDLQEKSLPAKSDPIRLIRIMHYGYMDAADSVKSVRNFDMILDDKEYEPDNAWLDYHLAAEYYRRKDYTKAFESVNSAIAKFLGNGTIPPSLAYKLKYDLLTATGNFPSVYFGVDKAIALYPDYVDLHFYKGISQLSHQEYAAAEKTFSHCIIIGESNPDYLILAGAGSFLAMHYLGICYEKQEKPELAAESYRQALLINPELDFARQRLAALDR